MFGLYTEKQVQKRIDETLARREEHDWYVRGIKNLERRFYELDQRLRALEGNSEKDVVCCTEG